MPIVLVAALDTKGDEARLVRDTVAARVPAGAGGGHRGDG